MVPRIEFQQARSLGWHNLVAAVRELYGQLFDDWDLERVIQRRWEEVVGRLIESNALPDLIEHAQRSWQEFRADLRRSHYARRSYGSPSPVPATEPPPPVGFDSHAFFEAVYGLQVLSHRNVAGFHPEAHARADQLLRAWLSPAQRAQFDRAGLFEVIGCDTGKRYRIRHQRQVNVDELDEKGEVVCTWCFLPEGQTPTGDCNLAQKIALENFETKALKKANRSGAGPGPVDPRPWSELLPSLFRARRGS
jgi:hypothetical protein